MIARIRFLIAAYHNYYTDAPLSRMYGKVWGGSKKGGDANVFDVRGWGYFTGSGQGGLDMSEDEGVVAHDAIGDYLTEGLNALPALLDTVEHLNHELEHLVGLLEPLERSGKLEVPGLATLNGARAALERAAQLTTTPEVRLAA